MLIDDNLQERFKFIEFLLYFKGRLTRNELVQRFGIGEATASRSIGEYMEKYPEQMYFLGARNGYAIHDNFTLNFEFDTDQGLHYIAYGQTIEKYKVPTLGHPIYDFVPKLDAALVSTLTRAIVSGQAFEVVYQSSQSEKSTRQVMCRTIFKSSFYWYFRVFDLVKKEYRNFKISRLISIKKLDYEIKSPKNIIKNDREWTKNHLVKIAPHPKAVLPEALYLDLGFKPNESRDFQFTVSEALIGFILLDLHVDCSIDFSLDPKLFPFCLKNREDLENIVSMQIAPGFTK